MFETQSYKKISECPFTAECPKYAKRGVLACQKEGNDYCSRFYKLDALYNNALLSEKQRLKKDIQPDTIDRAPYAILKAIDRDIVNFVNNGKSIFIHSKNCGNCKTTWALRLLIDYIKSGWGVEDPTHCPGLFINVQRYLMESKSDFSNQSEYVKKVEENVLKADLVVWDEMATKKLTTYEEGKLLMLINARLDMGKANIYTSNVPVAVVGVDGNPVELEMENVLRDYLGERLYSRVYQQSQDIVFNSDDKRGRL